MAYCDPADIYAHGVPRGAIPFPARLAASVSVVSNAIELDGHGFSLNDPMSFRAEAGGVLSTPLAEGTTYYAVPVDDSWFSVSVTSGGAVLDLTSTGSRVLVIAKLPVASVMAEMDRLIDDMLPAHVVPLEAPYPEVVRYTAAELVACKLMNLAGSATKSVADALDAAQKRIERWARGVPIRGTNAPAPACLAVLSASVTGDARGWSRYGGL